MKPLAQNTLIQNRYLIVQLIGKGGMGEVYLAVDQRLGSAVALKRTFFAGDEMLSNAFEREARILARMRHPVLPKVSDHFSEGEEQYLVMEHISGDDLAKRLEAAQKAFPLSWVMFWADQLLDALSYLHSHEPPIIHRDIKPQNLKLTDENHVILLDFGLSKNSGVQPVTSDSGDSSNTASVVGYTPHYAPMEQIRGIGTNPRSDIYSLSATLYQLLTNAVPPDALSRADTMLNGSDDPIRSPSELNSEIPEAVSVVILKGMEVSQDKRYETAREMQKAMRKAHANMQEAMSANTVVMTSEGTSQSDSVPVAVPSMDKTEVMDFAANPLLSVPTAIAGAGALSESPTNLISQPGQKEFDPNATVAFDMDADPAPPMQSDVKTEVFIAGSNSFPEPSQPTPSYPEAEASPDFGMTEDYRVDSNNGEIGESPFPAYAADATMPIIALAHGGMGDDAASPDDPYNSNESVPMGFESAAESGSNGEEIPSSGAAFVPAAAPAAAPVAAKKGSGGKVFAIVGGLFALFILGAVAIGGGLYYYNNYYAAAVEAEPSPSVMPSIEPTPEPTVDYSATNSDDSNTNSEDLTDSNSNAQDDLTVAPTPTPGPLSTPQQTVTTKPAAQTPAKTSPSKPAVPPAGKTTPKPQSTRDRKVILQ